MPPDCLGRTEPSQARGAIVPIRNLAVAIYKIDAVIDAIEKSLLVRRGKANAPNRLAGTFHAHSVDKPVLSGTPLRDDPSHHFLPGSGPMQVDFLVGKQQLRHRYAATVTANARRPGGVAEMFTGTVNAGGFDRKCNGYAVTAATGCSSFGLVFQGVQLLEGD